MFDAHFHLTEEDNFEEIYQKGIEAGVNYFMLAGTDSIDSKQYIELAEQYDCTFACVGMHPHEADTFDGIEKYRELACSSDKVKAIGEVGLDFFYDHSDREQQMKVLREFVALATELNLPLVIHCRDAEEDCYEILKDFSGRFLLHCFTGTAEWAEKFLELDAYFTVGGIITFKKAENVRETFKVIPDDRFFLETDSPYLSPVPFRGKRNQPAYISGTVTKVAEIRGWTTEETVARTSATAKAFFDIN